MENQIPEIENLISKGRYFEARLKIDAALKDSDDLRLKQLLSLIMLKSGMPDQAKNILEPLCQKDDSNCETNGILGSIYKTLFKINQQTDLASLASTTYHKNFLVTQNYYTGINAASMHIISGRGSSGRQIAKELIDLIPSSSDDFWHQATLGEAWLLLKERQKAIEHYQSARSLAGNEWGKIQSVHDQLKLLNFFIAVPSEILKSFSPPGIIAFIGYMMDAPGQAVERFPASIEQKIKESILSAIDTIKANVGYCSLACGSDILFAESMMESGGEVNIFLPFDREQYLNTCVKFAGDEWISRFERIEKIFPVNYITRDRYLDNDELFSFQNRIILGSAILKTSINFSTPTLLTVLSGSDFRQREGGTRDALSQWPFPERHVNINPDDFFNSHKNYDDYEGSPVIKSSDQKNVLYVVCIDLPGVVTYEELRFRKTIEHIMETLFIKPNAFLKSRELVASFQFPNSALEFIKEIFLLSDQSFQSKPRISLHAGLFTLQNGKLLDEEVSPLIDHHKKMPGGIIAAFGWAAPAIVINSENWSLDLIGAVGSDDSEPNKEVYALRFKK